MKKSTHLVCRSKHPLYHPWRTMHASCYNVDNSSYAYVGAKGIRVCPRWHSFEKFVEDVQVKQPKMFFTRRDRTKDFHPDNWQWMTVQEWKRTSAVCRLSKEKAAAMRAAYVRGVITLKELGRQFGCSTTTAHGVIHHKSWI